jgi:hypothetical protein
LPSSTQLLFCKKKNHASGGDKLITTGEADWANSRKKTTGTLLTSTPRKINRYE